MNPIYKNTDRGVLTLPSTLFQAGRVFAVGDVHGCYDLLMRGLDRANFDPACDSLVCVGDLIDRGPDSARCIQFLREDFVYAVLGNHEHMLLGAQESDEEAARFLLNGGRWWLTTPESLQQEILEVIRHLPYAIQVESPRGSVGFLHAEVPQGLSWQEFVAKVQSGDEKTIMTGLWGRKRISQNDDQGVTGIDRLFVGHTPTRPRRLGNIYPIDSGAVRGQMDSDPDSPLTIANVLSETQLLVAPGSWDGLRVIEQEAEERPFSGYAKPR